MRSDISRPGKSASQPRVTTHQTGGWLASAKTVSRSVPWVAFHQVTPSSAHSERSDRWSSRRTSAAESVLRRIRWVPLREGGGMRRGWNHLGGRVSKRDRRHRGGLAPPGVRRIPCAFPRRPRLSRARCALGGRAGTRRTGRDRARNLAAGPPRRLPMTSCRRSFLPWALLVVAAPLLAVADDAKPAAQQALRVAEEPLRDRDWAKAATALRDVRTRFPGTPEAVEAWVLEARALFLAGKSREALDAATGVPAGERRRRLGGSDEGDDGGRLRRAEGARPTRRRCCASGRSSSRATTTARSSRRST